MFGTSKKLQQKINNHQRDIDDIRIVNRQRHRNFRHRFEAIESRLDGDLIIKDALMSDLNKKLQWQNDALEDQVCDMFTIIDGLLESQQQQAMNQLMITEVFDLHNEKFEHLRRAINTNAESLTRYVKKYGDDEDRDLTIGFVGDEGQNGMGLSRAVNTAIENHAEGIEGDTVVPEDVQAFVDFLKSHVPDGMEVESVEISTGDGDVTTLYDAEDDAMGHHFEYDQEVGGAIDEQGNLHPLKVQTLESWRRNGPQNPADAIINMIRSARDQAQDGMAEPIDDQSFRVLGSAKLID